MPFSQIAETVREAGVEMTFVYDHAKVIGWFWAILKNATDVWGGLVTVIEPAGAVWGMEMELELPLPLALAEPEPVDDATELVLDVGDDMSERDKAEVSVKLCVDGGNAGQARAWPYHVMRR
jgi:hypothetical protein